jgi:hypothetical protein
VALKSSGPLGYVQQIVDDGGQHHRRRKCQGQASYVMLRPETNGLRWRDDGTDPTAGVGFPVSANETFVYDGDPTKIRVVSQTGTCTLNIAYFESRHP